MEAIFVRSSSQFAKQIGDMFLVVNGQLILGSPKKDHTTLADSYGQVAKLLFSVSCREDVFDLGGGILSPDDWSHIDIFEMVDRRPFRQRCAPQVLRSHRPHRVLLSDKSWEMYDTCFGHSKGKGFAISLSVSGCRRTSGEEEKHLGKRPKENKECIGGQDRLVGILDILDR